MDRGAEFPEYRLPADDTSGWRSSLDRTAPDVASVSGFAVGTRIKTLNGELRAESLRRGDRVLTRDNGYQIVRWAGQVSARSKAQSPVRLRKGALGRGVPDRGLLVGPEQHLLIGSARFPESSDPPEVLIVAADLTCLPGISLQRHHFDGLIQILLDRHELIAANGAWCASFRPTRAAIASLSPLDRTVVATRLSDINKEIHDYDRARPEPDRTDIRKGLIPVRRTCLTGATDPQVTRDRT